MGIWCGRPRRENRRQAVELQLLLRLDAHHPAAAFACRITRIKLQAEALRSPVSHPSQKIAMQGLARLDAALVEEGMAFDQDGGKDGFGNRNSVEAVMPSI